MYLYRGHSANTSYGNGDGVDKETSKNDIETGHIVKKSDVLDTNFSMYIFLELNLSFLVSQESLIILQRATKRICMSVYLK